MKKAIYARVPLTDIMVRLFARLITGIKGYAPGPITQHFRIAEQKSPVHSSCQQPQMNNLARGGVQEYKEYDEVHFKLHEGYGNSFLLFQLDMLSIR